MRRWTAARILTAGVLAVGGPVAFASSQADASISGCTLVSGGVDEYPNGDPWYIAGRIGYKCDGNKAPYAWIDAQYATDSGCRDLSKIAAEGTIGTYRYSPRNWGVGVQGYWKYCTNSTTKQQNLVPPVPAGGGGSW